MTDAELNALEASAKAATPGPWEPLSHMDIWVMGPATDRKSICLVGYARDRTENEKNAAYIAAANPDAILELIAELRERTTLLEEIYADLGEKINGACNVCWTYTHKHWCYYPNLAKILGKPLDEFDTKFLAAKEATKHD